MFSFSAVKGVVSMRWLTFDAVALPDRSTGVRVDAHDVWSVSRPASEKVPAGVHEIDVTSALPGKAPFVERSVTSAAKVRRIVALLDAMEIVQPGVAVQLPSVPGRSPGGHNRLPGDGRRAAARARPRYRFRCRIRACNPVDLSIGRHRQTPMIGGEFVKQTERLLRVNLLAG